MIKVTSYFIRIVAPGYIKMLKSSGWSVNMFSMFIQKACHLINRDILHKVLSWWFYVRPQCARIIVMKTTKMCKRKYMNDYCPNRKRTSSSFIHKLPPLTYDMYQKISLSFIAFSSPIWRPRCQSQTIRESVNTVPDSYRIAAGPSQA